MRSSRFLALCGISTAGVLLGLAAPALGNPINPLQPFPPFPPTLVAILLEAIVVMLIVWRAVPGLRMVRFMLIWYAVNLVSVYVVMVQMLPALAQMIYPPMVERPSFLGGVLLEISIVSFEGALLLWMGNARWLGAPDKPALAWKRVLVAVVVGNLVSFAAIAPVHHFWPEILMPDIYKKMIVE